MNKNLVLTLILGSYFTLLVGSGGESSEERSKKINELKSAQADNLDLADLAKIFKMGSKVTDLQREAKEKEITGKVIEGSFKVYDVTASGEDCFKIQASQTSSAPGAFIKACNGDADGVGSLAASLTEGDVIRVKGVITGTTMRNLDINPALISK